MSKISNKNIKSNSSKEKKKTHIFPTNVKSIIKKESVIYGPPQFPELEEIKPEKIIEEVVSVEEDLYGPPPQNN